MVTTPSEQEQPEARQEIRVDTESFVCRNCGGTVKFDIKKQIFACVSCKTEYDLETLSDTVKEHDFDAYLARERETIPFAGMAVVTCGQCGTEITFSESQFAAACPMCGSSQVAATKQSAGIPPDGVIPFKIDKQDAQARFRGWVKSRWFAPNDFKNRSAEGNLLGMFLPFWTYDAHTVSAYRGRGGRHRTERDKDNKTRIVTDWYPVQGVVSSAFDDIQICASHKEENIEGILPYGTTTGTQPFSTGYLSGFYAEVYKVKANEGFERAKQIMEGAMRNLAARDICQQGYDEADVQSLSTQYSRVTYKHVLLPLWSSAFSYKDKLYSYAINGETGAVSGKRPYSAIKIALAVLAAAAAAFAVHMLTQGG